MSAWSLYSSELTFTYEICSNTSTTYPPFPRQVKLASIASCLLVAMTGLSSSYTSADVQARRAAGSPAVHVRTRLAKLGARAAARSTCCRRSAWVPSGCSPSSISVTTMPNAYQSCFLVRGASAIIASGERYLSQNGGPTNRVRMRRYHDTNNNNRTTPGIYYTTTVQHRLHPRLLLTPGFLRD